MKSTMGAISIAASAPKLDVDNRISLQNYYRIANNLIKQADIYREEKNIIDLYVMLLRFSSLITETIPYHRDYHTSLQGERLLFKKRLFNFLNELETLKPEVQRCVEELNRKSSTHVSKWGLSHQVSSVNKSLEWPSINKHNVKNDTKQIYTITGQGGVSRSPFNWQDRLLQSMPTEGQSCILSLNSVRPKQETLSRHSILGLNGLSGHWQPPIISQRVQYPSNIDLSPIEISSLPQPEQVNAAKETSNSSVKDKSLLEEVLSLHDVGVSVRTEEQSSLISFDTTEVPLKMDLNRDPSPPPVRAEVEELSEHMSLSEPELVRSECPLEVHISTSMMESFLRVAKSNTDRNLETCGVIAGSLKNKKFYVTALIVPKQEGTPDSCQTTNEEEIFDYQDKHSLFPLGWIHIADQEITCSDLDFLRFFEFCKERHTEQETHPTQSCFMSSVDLHTHYSYQVMLPEAIAIVLAPSDNARKHGIFRLTAPGGMSVIRNCDQRGFHPHSSPPEGGPIYDNCSDVYMNPSLKFDVIDLR